MSETKLVNVSLQESTEIFDKVYQFIKTINSCEDCLLEYLEEKAPSLCMKRVGTAYKTKQNIIGGYNAELPFIMYRKVSVKDTQSILEATRPLDVLATAFEEESSKGFPNLKLPEGCIPFGLEMVETPEDASGKENNEAIFMAIYKLHYKKK